MFQLLHGFVCFPLLCLTRLAPLECVQERMPYCTRTAMALGITSSTMLLGGPRHLMMQYLAVYMWSLHVSIVSGGGLGPSCANLLVLSRFSKVDFLNGSKLDVPKMDFQNWIMAMSLILF